MNENEEQTVNQALETGRKILVRRCSIITRIMVAMLIVLCCFRLINIPVMLLLMAISTFLFQWGYRSYMLTKWKIWAFENTRNVHELKAKAILEEWLPETPGYLEEWLQTPEEKRRLNELEKKFDIPDTLDNYHSVEEETRIHSPKRNYWGPIVFFSLAIVAILLYYWLRRKWDILLILLPLSYLLWNSLRKPSKNAPYIVLNDNGIETMDCSFVPWSVIEDEQVLQEKDEDVSYYLFFRHPGGTEKVSIGQLPIKPGELYDLLKIYRKRFNDRVAQ